ncbi:hypothetical protein BB005_00920 [Neisseria gonorrhoeae]|nr:hypothetical protein BB005_00920 [Neisseria gonorrhoeae]
MHPLASPTLRNILRTHPVKNTRTVPIHRNPKTRHSRAGGNPVRSVSAVSDRFLPRCGSRFPPVRE